MPADIPGGLLIRAYRDGDERAILGLFNRYFPHAQRGVEHFRWKYRQDPFGNERISLAFAGAQLVGHYAGYAVPFRIDGRDAIANQIGDTMTEQSVRHIGRGPTSVLGQTALHFYEQFCEGRVAFNYGFNVANIQKFSLRFLRSDRVEPVTYRVASPLPPIRRAERWVRGYSLELVREAGAEFDELFARVSGAYRFCVARNAMYVRWRYLERPDLPYLVIAVRKWRRLVGWVACRIEKSRFLWGDALFDPRFPDAAEVLLRHVVPSHPAVTTIEGWFPPRPRCFDDTLVSLGFASGPQPDDLSLMCVPFTFTDATARMRQDLYYTWGDSDLF
ncbi:MAG: GNAT family N-acetyltransferase [Thermoanaerobaculia bacterium]